MNDTQRKYESLWKFVAKMELCIEHIYVMSFRTGTLTIKCRGMSFSSDDWKEINKTGKWL